jgi:flagellar hook-associated protein 3 FlgL
MKIIPSFLIANLARVDITRITGELYDLQRQTASGYRAADLKGYGDDAGRIINARSVIAQVEARKLAAVRLQTRLEVQDAALEKAASAASTLKADVMQAISSDNATFLAQQLQTAFSQALGAFNQVHEGQAVFTGERRGASAVRIASLADLPAAITDAQMFNESDREQTIDLGFGSPFAIAEKVSAVGGDFFDAMRDLKNHLDGGGFGNPITAAERALLVGVAEKLETGRATIVEAQGRNGDATARLGREVERLTAQATMVENHMDQAAGSDLAEVSMRLASSQAQYQAIAKVFSDIRNLTLVNFLD